MNETAKWFKDGANKCAEDHARTVREWTNIVRAGWALVIVCWALAMIFLFAGFIVQFGFMAILDVVMCFRLKEAYKNRDELAQMWLEARDLYLKNYERYK